MQYPFLKQLYPPTQTPIIISVARKLRFRQLPQFINVRYESPSLIIMKSLLIQSLNDAFVLNDVFLCGAHSFKEILSKYMDHALGLGGVDEVEAISDERVVEGYDIVVVLEFGDEVSDDFPGGFDLWGFLVICGCYSVEVAERTFSDFCVGEWGGGCHDVCICFSCWT
jgi:hypothetical protein